MGYGDVSNELQDLLIKAGDKGMSLEDIMRITGVNKKKAEWRVRGLKSKRHLNVKIIQGVAYLKSTTPVESKTVKRQYTKRNVKVSVRKEDLNDYLDFVHKSKFYEKCAKALVETNMEIDKLRKEMS